MQQQAQGRLAAADAAAAAAAVSSGVAAGPSAGAGGGGYLQKNFHVDGNLFSVLTLPTRPDKPAPKTTKTRGRRKARWKLKFHHQALPPEYREHYEAAKEAGSSTAGPSTSSVTNKPSVAPKPTREERSSAAPKPSPKSTKRSSQASPGRAGPSLASAPSSAAGSAAPAAPQERVTELPYMGEITLDSKPRRGRKPKKADICHLIYKNYGTVFPSPKTDISIPEPPIRIEKPKMIWTKEQEEIKNNNSKNVDNNSVWTTSSLLEKRLMGGSRTTNLSENLSDSRTTTHNSAQQNGSCTKLQNKHSTLTEYLLNKRESLNLGLNFQPSSSRTANFPTPSRDPGLAQACVQRLLAYAAGLDEQHEPLNLCTRDLAGRGVPLVKVEPSSGSDSEPEEMVPAPETPQPGGYVFWPSAGVFVHPQLLYKPPTPAPTVLPSTATAPSRVIKKKRKRSAIFIPPAESPTEVSICKFKFTGGAKPSLEEKKMLSVDAEGHFRFYSGTDKGMRSFLPHLQHPPVLSSATPQPPPPPPSRHTSEDFSVQPSTSSAVLPSPESLRLRESSSPSERHGLNSKRKRRSRKSEVREKLEQTFKEKGFLIQTQQLESAEGATYCKFRQLRKFTRYLFRSWRDYLPNSIQDLSQSSPPQHHELSLQQESSLPSLITGSPEEASLHSLP